MVTLGRMKSTVDEDVMAVISGSDVNESILSLGSFWPALPSLTAGDSSQSFGLPFHEMQPVECYSVGTPENHIDELVMETLTGKHLQCPFLCGVAWDTITVWRDTTAKSEESNNVYSSSGSLI